MLAKHARSRVEAHDSGKLVRDWVFGDFMQAMTFVNRVAELAESAGHHPDIDIRYNQVRLGLVSHDSGGITNRDAAMADSLSKEFGQKLNRRPKSSFLPLHL